ncbi:probable DHA14-like major facilitator; ABC transporter [Serendipita indica DSM 11827]|uniref:Probable DHA14-like major facilitator ABC transporter n=1 Tax=Serendipita indica (strain DSM 11827) TaxID=1109443 RepID=G4T5N1_SERID|nr:probable DHA14-like major facilitator; ABC transporter [Serendipita indica DSM 11827]
MSSTDNPSISLSVPTAEANTAATSISPSRSETLIEGNASVKHSDELSKEADGPTKSTEAAPRTDSAVATHKIHSANDKSNEKGLSKEKRDLEADPVVEAGGGEDDPDSDRYITGFRLVLVFVGLLLSIFLVSLDQTIIATALPVIASKFNALNDLTWVVSAYFFTQCGLVLFFGQVLTIMDTKESPTSHVSRSLFCGVAWNMPFLIFGRAIAGVGAAGIFISILTIISRVTRLEDRPILFGAFGAVFAVSSVAGPLMGGAFTDHLSWRWCFYINLPFGAVSILAVIFFLKAQPTRELPGNAGKTKLQKWIGIDWIGTTLCLGMIMPLLLALQWGGNTRPWNDKVVIALFCVFAVMLPSFVAWQWKLGPRAIMPLSLYKRRTQIGTSACSFFVMMNLILGTYYLPFYYQASRGRTPTQSGIDILPFMLTIILAAAISGAIINFTGRYIYFLRYATLVSAIGAGLLYTLDLHTSNAKLIGYQIIFGLGIGCALQNAIIAVQAEWADKDELIPQATSIVTFFQLMGGILGIAIAGSVFANQLRKNIAIFAPGLDPRIAEAVRQTLSVLEMLPQEVQGQVIQAYLRALNYVFIVAIPTSVLASISAFLIKDHNVKERGSAGGAMMA